MLPPCPEPPSRLRENCVRETHPFALSSEVLFRLARRAVLEIGAFDVEFDDERLRLDAVFRVFFFKDDVAVQVEPAPGGSLLHVRSASRVGDGDLGVNRRRVRRFMKALDREIEGYRA